MQQDNENKPWLPDYPYPVRIWLLTVAAAFIYTIALFWWRDGLSDRSVFDRIVTVYTFLSIIIFLGFFHTRDPA